jgi:hypothetical protein
MIHYIGFAILISVLLYILLIRTSEGFSDMPRLSHNPAWAKLSDDQVIELVAIRLGTIYVSMIIDEQADTDAVKTIKDIMALIPPETKEVNNQSDINGLKNMIINKASENKNLSVLFSVLQSHFKNGLKLHKRIYEAQQKNDRNAIEVVVEDSKALAKRGIREIKDKIPNFPFSKFLKDSFPEGFVEVPKPTATECKRFFKCSSIYAA